MSKRKRNSLDLNNEESKAGTTRSSSKSNPNRSSKRKSKEGPTGKVDLPVLIDLVDSEDVSHEALGRGGGGGQASKKKKMDIVGQSSSKNSRTTRSSSKDSKQPPTSPPTPPHSAGEEDSENQDFSSALLAPFSKSNNNGNSEYLTPPSLIPPPPHSFKVPDLPGPSSRQSKTRVSNVTLNQTKKKKSKPTPHQIQFTEKSRKVRKAIIEVMHDHIEGIVNGSETQIGELINNLWLCVEQMSFIFATKRYACNAEPNDLSKTSEIDEFARWWLFGLTALLFSSPADEAVKEMKEEIKSLIRVLCQFLNNGHPTIVYSMIPQVLRVLRDLTVRGDEDRTPVIKIHFQEGQPKKNFTVDIKITERNQWAIPHFLQSVSFLFPRVFFYSFHMRHVLVELFKRVIERNPSTQGVAAVLPMFSCCLLPGITNVTEIGVVSLFQRVLEASTSPMFDMCSSRFLFSQYDILQDSAYTEFLEESGLYLLQKGLTEFVYSNQFLLLYTEESNKTVLSAFKFLVECSQKNQVSTEVVNFCKLTSLIGADSTVHPLLEKLLLREFSEFYKAKAASSLQQNPIIKAKSREVSRLWDKLMERWELTMETMIKPFSRPTAGNLSVEAQKEAVNCFRRSCAMLKLIRSLKLELKNLTTGIEYNFLELKHVLSWCRIAFREISIAQKYTPNLIHELYLSTLETLEHLDACNWFGFELSVLRVHELLGIPGWPWLSKHVNLLPKSFQPMSEFTKNDYTWITDSKTLLSKTLRALRLEAFRPWKHFVQAIFSEVMNMEIVVENRLMVLQLLDLISDVGWPLQEFSLHTLFNFILLVLQSELWTQDSQVRSCLASAIVALPCICSLNLHKNGRKYLPAKSGCQICIQNQELNGRQLQLGTDTSLHVENLPERYLRKILLLAVPLLKSKFLLVKTKLLDLMIKCHNHLAVSSTGIILPVMQVAVNGKVILCEEAFRKVGLILSEDSENLNTTCPNRLYMAQKIFGTLPGLIANTQKKTRRARLSVASKVLKGFLLLASCQLGLGVFVELVKCMVWFLAQNDKIEVTILCQKIVAKYSSVFNCQPFELMSRVRHDVAPEIIKIAVKTFYNQAWDRKRTGSEQKCADFIARLFLLGEFRYSKMFTHYYYPSMLEHIVPKLHSEPTSRFLLKAIASHSGENEQMVLQDWIINYFPTLLLDYSSENVSRCLQYLLNSYGFDAMFAAKQQEQRILNEALCRLEDRQDKVIRVLPHLCKWDEASIQQMYNSGTSKTMSRSEIQELLNRRLLGFFLHLDTKLHSRIETVETKKKIVKSFTALIQIMNKSKITSLRSKVYKTLNSMTDEGQEYYDVLYDAWKAFANNLDSSCLQTMTPQILAALLPLRNSPICAQVDGLFSHFVCYKKEFTAPIHHELYFLLDQCGDTEVVKTIGDIVDAKKKRSWLDYFNMLVKESSHENSHLRHQAFKKLRDVFRFDSELVEKVVLVKGQLYVSQVISTLLAGLRGDSDDKVKSLIVDCLGCLGALDPVRFRDADDDMGSKTRSGSTFSGQIINFATHYLQELIREFQEAKDTTNFDYCACLIQQVLQEFKVQPTSEDPFWRLLTTSSQELITPLLTTKYQMDSNIPLPKVDCPIYLSEHGRTFDTWLLNWLTVLISCITPTEPQAFSLFNKSKHLLRRNSRIAAFIVPYVAKYAIFCGTPEQRERVVTEIKTVLERWTVLDAMKIEAHSTVPIKDSQTEFGVTDKPTVENESVFHFRCTQVIFSILDHLLRAHAFSKRRWGLKKANEQSRNAAKTSTPPMTETNMEAVDDVLKKIPSSLISQVAFDCESYTIALYYLEQELRSDASKEKLQKNLGYLQRIYVSLNDMDSVAGIATVRESEPSLCEVVLENIAKGKMEDATRNLEKMIAIDSSDLIAHNALVQAYLNLEEPHKAELLIKGTIHRKREWELALEEVQLESLIKLKDWSSLKTQVEKIELPILEEKMFTWNTALARALSKIQCNEFGNAEEIVERLRLKSVGPLVAASEEMHPYKRGYYNVVQLHILTEIEEAVKLLRKHSKNIGRSTSSQGALYQDVKRMLIKWDARLRNVSKTRKVIDQILNVRKSLFEIMKSTFQPSNTVCEALNASIRECWLDMARDASKCGNFIRADNCLLEAKKFMSPKVLIQEAKILSRKGEKENAILVLQKGINQYFPQREAWKLQNQRNTSGPGGQGTSVSASRESQMLCSKALLLLAKLCEEQKLLDMEDYIAKYKEAADVYKDSEKNYFTLGSYHDRLWGSSNRQCLDVQASVVRYYSQSLLHGCKYIYQSLPRLLSIWFDFAASLHQGEFSKPSYSTTNSSITDSDSPKLNSSSFTPDVILGNMKLAIKNMVDGVPAYILMTAFSQLISRLCHSHQGTWSLLKEIIVGIICTHPYQALWMTMAVSKSVNAMRRNRCIEIFKSVEKQKPQLKLTISHYLTLTEKLIGLSEVQIDRQLQKVNISHIYKSLPKLIKGNSFGKVCIPYQIFMNPSLPQIGVNHKDHDPYPETLVYISDIEETVEVMPSLIRPKRITLLASNGKSYGLMCKPKDDLRKDSKVMEVNNVVNWYLNQNAESSQRHLRVRTFSVVPLNEEVGLLEWVPNLQGMRQILLSLYKEKNISTSRDIRTLIDRRDPLEVKRLKFIERLLNPHPAVFREWFFNNFNDHQSWYAARMAYIRTAAVMSMVGYIMGLGDRHGENILLDSVTGEVVHVDFNCLFNKGETFEWIERVPFRLTKNMVDAMGPLGYEGIFRRSCEIVMNMFREHSSIFLSVLRPFVFDPLVEWGKEYRGPTAMNQTGEVTNEKAVETMKYIRNRINGTARNLMREINTELSVEAQVKYLIDEATSVDNLCQMYIGWAAYL